MKRKKKGGKRIFVVICLLIVIGLFAVLGVEVYHEYQYPLKYEEHIYHYAETYEVDPYLVMAVIRAESNFIADAQSHKDAKGLMQLMDETATEVAEKIGLSDFSTDQLTEPRTNIQLGVWYLSYLLKEFDGEKTLALAAYNAGIGRVKQWLDDPELSSDGERLDDIPYKETKRYVEKVLNYAEGYQNLY